MLFMPLHFCTRTSLSLVPLPAPALVDLATSCLFVKIRLKPHLQNPFLSLLPSQLVSVALLPCHAGLPSFMALSHQFCLSPC